MSKKLDHLKVVLTVKQKTNKLEERLDKDPATINKWCTNSCQPSLETMVNIAKILGVDINEQIKNTILWPHSDITIRILSRCSSPGAPMKLLVN